jgi:prepilin-type processing-associated H-X9-DG protein
LFPTPRTAGTFSRTQGGWPSKAEDAAATVQPIITDLCLAEGTRNTNIFKATAGHSIGKNLVNVNLTFADGHVETRPRARLQWQQSGNWTTFY